VIVVTDTSVVLNLAWLREDRLLPELFGQVLAPPIVRAEFERLTRADLRFHVVAQVWLRRVSPHF
jgi:predicted nucleic acid-binding protein